MDNLSLYSSSSSSSKLFLGFTPNPRIDPVIISNKPLFCSFKTPKRNGLFTKSKTSISAVSNPHGESNGNYLHAHFLNWSKLLFFILFCLCVFVYEFDILLNCLIWNVKNHTF